MTPAGLKGAEISSCATSNQDYSYVPMPFCQSCGTRYGNRNRKYCHKCHSVLVKGKAECKKTEQELKKEAYDTYSKAAMQAQGAFNEVAYPAWAAYQKRLKEIEAMKDKTEQKKKGMMK